ncbi:MAG: radical SAM protein [Clostridia bacterium]|nr:radical SAM protein [Clostridia bacterium]
MSANGCTACPRECGKSRVGEELGFCQAPNEFVIARIARHAWEEPCISGKDGSGTVFFSGCNLRCVYCQNRVISHTAKGEILTPDELEAQMLRLQEEGAHNINLVTPSHYALQLRPLLAHIKPRLHIPIVYNCGGYEKTETLRTLDGLVDVYLPDIKYFDGHRAQLYSAAPGYFPTAVAALREMLRQVGRCEYDTDGMMTRGVIVRHLVLPGGRQDSIALLQALYKEFGSQAFPLSLMSQYTPEFATDCPFPELHRRVTSFEYDAVCKEAQRLGFDGYVQERESASSVFTPDFFEKTF